MLPILYQSPEFILYSYPLLMGLGWGMAYQLFFSKVDIPQKFAQILFWGIFVFAWIGSKLFFYLTTESVHQHDLLLEASFWTGGGFVFYGGLLFGILFLAIYKISQFPLTLKTLWSILPAITAGHAIGRIGCLLAGCCYGAETSSWWGIELHGTHRHPTQLLETLGLLLLLILLLKTRPTLRSVSFYFMGYGILRFGIECLRGDLIRGMWGVFTPSQWISLALVLGGSMLFYSRKFKDLQEDPPI